MKIIPFIIHTDSLICFAAVLVGLEGHIKWQV